MENIRDAIGAYLSVVEEQLHGEEIREIEVARTVFPSRSRAIQTAVAENLARMERSRLATEWAKLDPKAEQILAEEGMSHRAKTRPEF